MPETVLRQIVMLKMLPREPWSITTTQLKSKLLDEEGYKVTLRTIQRDLQKLSLVFPISCKEDIGQNQTLGWYWPKIAKAEVFPSMGPMVALTYKLAERFLQDLLPPSTLEHLGPYFSRADEVLKNAHTSRLRHWPDYVRIIPRAQSFIPAPIKPGVADAICQSHGRPTNKRVLSCEEPPKPKDLRYQSDRIGIPRQRELSRGRNR